MINGGIEGLLRAEARDEAAAQDLRQVIQGFVALGRMQVGPEHPEISDFIESLQLTGQGKTVSLGFAVPSAMIDVLTKLRAGAGPGKPSRSPRHPSSGTRRQRAGAASPVTAPCKYAAAQAA